ncbi:MAG: PD40 domain-containing protein [Bacteroidales bacterium]|nr:PD40 domain-containing protein [Bacteroidales bacterium]
MKLHSILIAAALAATTLCSAQNPSWIRRNAISPDGKTIAFSYKGDIYTVPSQGGRAVQVTSNPAYESEPIWTKDSRQIVFISYREESKDIYVVDAEGGTPKRLTFTPGNETPLAVLPDGKVLFTFYNQNMMSDNYDGFPGQAQLYETDLDGSAPRLVTSLPIMSMSVNQDGTVLYEDYKGYEDALRKHHTSSVTRDIWKYVPATASGRFTINGKGSFTKICSYEGEDRNPVFAADGDTFYYLSERDGKTSNIFRSSLSKPETVVQLTFADKNPVRFLSVAKDGTLAYSYNGDLYTLREGSQPRKVEITLTSDVRERELQRTSYTSGATSMAVSPNGKEIAIVLRGDVFVTSIDYQTTRRITNTAEQERSVDFSEDGRTLYYSAERNGCWSIYKTSLTEKEDKYFTYAVKLKEEIVSTPGQTCFQPDVSPDGKYVAYYRDRTELVVKEIKSGAEKSLFKGINYSYSDGDQGFEWSPDSHYILCNWGADGGWNNADVALIDVETGAITNLTQSGYSDGGFRWALGGKAMTWTSDKNGYRSHGSWGAHNDVYIMFFDGKAYNDFGLSKENVEIAELLKSEKEIKTEEKKEQKDSVAKEKNKIEKLVLDLDNREDRIVRLTTFSNQLGDHYLSEDGKKLYFIQRLEKGSDLCIRDIQEGSISVLQKGISGGLIPSADGKFLYVSSRSGISRIATAGGKTDRITFSGEFEYKPREERAYMFEHIWKQMNEKFYLADLAGCDWQYYHDNYVQFLPHIDNNFDFQDLLSEMLGEMNGSHTGGRYYYPSTLNMGYLGVIYDNSWTGDGAKIAEVLPGGAIAKLDSEIKPGDVICTIEGIEIKAGEPMTKFLANKAGKKIAITIEKGGKKQDYYITPSSSDATPLYRRWVRQREQIVEKLSGGKVGYVHIQGMNSDSFRELYSKARGKYRTCGALIVDTRHNGGGWLHDDIVTFLGGKLYYQYIPRGQYIGDEPFNKWTKPSCMLVGEDNYSDASGTPYAYRQLGIGKLIGAPIPGTMTAVWWESQIDPTIIFGIPQVGNWQVDEQIFTENHQIEPDILIYNDPASVLNGRDLQLEKAVEEMLKAIKE